MGRRGSIQLARVMGIRIGADYGWFLILFLAIWFLSRQFVIVLDGEDTVAYAAAVATAFLFFGSIVLHELGHAVAARREGIDVAGIDLFLFGGLMHMRSEPETPGAEFRVAVAGPLATLAVIVVGSAIAIALEGTQGLVDAATLTVPAGGLSVPMLLIGVVVSMNIVVLAFNLVPAYPLDGGRIARAAVWKATGDRHKATRAAAAVGRWFGIALIGVGIALAASGDVADGVYLAILGFLLYSQARGVTMQTAVAERLEGVTVADIMDTEPVTVPADTSALRTYEDFFLRYGYDWFAVVEPDGRYVGRVLHDPVMEAAEGPNAELPARRLAADAGDQVDADVTLEALVGSEPLRRLGALTATDAEGRLRGVVTFDAMMRALERRLTPART